MTNNRPCKCSFFRRLRLTAVLALLIVVLAPSCLLAQAAANAETTSDAALAPDAAADPAAAEANAAPTISERLVSLGIPQPLPFLWDLGVQGGIFMIPIGLCSIVVVAYAIERRVGLRKTLIIPPELLAALQKLNLQNNGIDPRLAYDVCQKYRSPLATVLQAAILKVGRPQPELEKAVEDAVSREADQMAENIRPINVSASISPLFGLLGTVQGMIMAFMVISSSTSTGAAKGQELALGIYTALVTTFAGLCVAIPAIVLANILEGRIERLLRGMEDVFNEIVPLFERFEGKWRIARKNDASGVVLRGTAPRQESPTSAKANIPDNGPHSGERTSAHRSSVTSKEAVATKETE